MNEGHSHPGAVSAAGRHRGRLVVAFVLTGSYMVVELVAGLATGSLALLSDAAHMGTDVLGLGMALAAIVLAQRPPTDRRTFGHYRLEVLAALANGVLLFGVAGYVLFEAFRRFSSPPEVAGLPLLAVAAVGLLVNIVSFRLLTAGAKDSVNLRGAYLEVLGDMLGSLGVIAAALIIYVTGWQYADPIIGASIGLFILPRTWQLSRSALRILMQAAPSGLDMAEVRERIQAVPGVVEVRDLHVWTLTSGMDQASVHATIAQDSDRQAVLEELTTMLSARYGISHATIQCEPATAPRRALPI